MESYTNSTEVQEGNNIGASTAVKKMSSEEEDERNSISASPLFECPISLQVMSDPVTVCTSLTYDRTSIQNWLRLHHGNNNICPLTGQTLHTRELIPNHTLAALIQKWRLTNPQAEKNKKMLQHMIAQIDKDGASCKIEALRQLKNLARDESNRSHLQSLGILPALIRVIQGFDLVYPAEEEAKAAQEAIAAIVLFSGDDATSCSTDLMSGPAIRTVEWMLAKGDLESRISAADLVEKLAKADDSVAAEIGSMEGVTEGLLALLQHNYALHSALRALVPLCRVVAYRVKIAEAVGVIPLLIRLIAGSERGVIEASMAILEALSTVFQGRCGIMADSVAVTAIVRNLVHVSRVATAHGVGILLNICKNCNKEDEIRELVRSGVVQKLVALLHMKCEPRTKKRINFLIKILSPLDNYESCAQFVIHL